MAMLEEIENVKQVPDDYRRRWFTDNYFDLIVWYTESGALHGFQLCYDRLGDEHALTWLPDQGFKHNRIDNTFKPYSFKKTAILVADGIVPIELIKLKFVKTSKELHEDIKQFVLEKLFEYERIIRANL